MAQNTATADGGIGREPTRFSETVSAAKLVEGDRVDPRLVARTSGQLGERINPHKDAPETQLLAVTALHRYDDVHSALLVDPEAGVFIRAGRHASNQAWSQAEADWTVREIGSEVVVDEVHELTRPEQEQDDPVLEYAQAWVKILFDELRHGSFNLGDEQDWDGTTLKLNDYDGRKLLASISLE